MVLVNLCSAEDETYIHRQCQLENVLMVLSVESTECYHFLVLERFHLTLEKYLKKHGYIDVEILKGIIKGLEYLHKRSIVHGNLTTSNVFLRGSDDPSYIAKLGGLAGSSKRQRKRNNKGDPEIRSDLFDLAVTLLRCVSFNRNQTWQELKIRFDNEAAKPRATTPEAYHLIMKLVGESNLKISEVLRDPFFLEVDDAYGFYGRRERGFRIRRT